MGLAGWHELHAAHPPQRFFLLIASLSWSVKGTGMAGSFFCFTTIKRPFPQSYSANWIWYSDVAEARRLCSRKSLHGSSFAIKAQVAGRMTETPRRRSKVNSTTKMFAGGEISIGAWAGGEECSDTL